MIRDRTRPDVGEDVLLKAADDGEGGVVRPCVPELGATSTAGVRTAGRSPLRPFVAAGHRPLGRGSFTRCSRASFKSIQW